MTNEIVKQDTQEVQKPLAWLRKETGEVTTSEVVLDAWLWNESHVIELGDMSALRKENENLNAEVLKLHRELAGEKLRADQGWARYESANRMLMSANVEIMQMKGGAA